MKSFDVIIVGGGASGLFTALNIDKNKKVAIFDTNFSLGKKILVTGNGRCNLTNLEVSSKFYNANIDDYLKMFDSKKTIKYFNDLGLITYADAEGRVYPVSNSAKSVIDVLIYNLHKRKNISLFTNSTITKIEKDYDKYYVLVNGDTYSCQKLVIATCKYDKTLFNFDINSIKGCPSLVALKTAESTKNLDGLRINDVKITAECCGKKMSQVGELLFKSQGLSGIAIFNLSTLFARNKCTEGKIIVDLLPKYTEKELFNLISSRVEKFESVKELFIGIFVDVLRSEILAKAKINENKSTKTLKNDEIFKICSTIKHFEYNMIGFYDNSQVTSGGVSLSDLSLNLEHKKHKNLYFVGEVIDVDGECGGYNLQWAWTSGYVVGKNI